MFKFKAIHARGRKTRSNLLVIEKLLGGKKVRSIDIWGSLEVLPPNSPRVLNLQFDDIEVDDQDGRLLDEGQARVLLKRLQQWSEEGVEQILVTCEWGAGRSVAVASAIAAFCNGEAALILHDIHTTVFENRHARWTLGDLFDKKRERTAW